MDGVPMLAAVPAPEIGLTVAGFLRGGSMNVHTCVERVSPQRAAAWRVSSMAHTGAHPAG